MALLSCFLPDLAGFASYRRGGTDGATAIYVVATIVMMNSMARSNQLARAGIELTAKIEAERIRPHVLFYLEFDVDGSNSATAVLVNIGATAAYNVRVSVEPKIEVRWHQEDPETGLTRKAIPYLPPGHREVDLLDVIPEFLKRYPRPEFHGEVKFHDSQGTEYTVPVHLGYEYRQHIGRSRRPHPGEELKNLRTELIRALQDISRHFDRDQ
jgi:hypothetical protein